MRKHYGQVDKTCIKIAFASALLLVISGVLSYAIKGKVIAILEIIAGVNSFCAVIFIRNKRNERCYNFLEIMAEKLKFSSANIMDSFPIPIVVEHIDGSICWYKRQIFRNCFLIRTFLTQNSKIQYPDIKWGEIFKISLTL